MGSFFSGETFGIGGLTCRPAPPVKPARRPATMTELGERLAEQKLQIAALSADLGRREKEAEAAKLARPMTKKQMEAGLAMLGADSAVSVNDAIKAAKLKGHAVPPALGAVAGVEAELEKKRQAEKDKVDADRREWRKTDPLSQVEDELTRLSRLVDKVELDPTRLWAVKQTLSQLRQRFVKASGGDPSGDIQALVNGVEALRGDMLKAAKLTESEMKTALARMSADPSLTITAAREAVLFDR
jgi:hypothetical protein